MVLWTGFTKNIVDLQPHYLSFCVRMILTTSVWSDWFDKERVTLFTWYFPKMTSTLGVNVRKLVNSLQIFDKTLEPSIFTKYLGKFQTRTSFNCFCCGLSRLSRWCCHLTAKNELQTFRQKRPEKRPLRQGCGQFESWILKNSMRPFIRYMSSDRSGLI